MSHSSILSFGRYLPSKRIRTEEIASQHDKDPTSIIKGLGIKQKTVPCDGDDTFTMAYEAAKTAITSINLPSSQISAVFVGSESHPYAVKPTSGMIAQALELSPFCHAADLEFACKAGTAAVQIIDSMVRAGQIDYGLAIGSDKAQSKSGDALEYSAAAGAAAFIIGKSTSKNALCRIDHTLSFTTDTPDFWRANGADAPSHAGRFTGEPAYFKHMRETINGILEISDTKITDYDHIVLHMPNAKFPSRIAKEFGMTKEQMERGFIVPEIGNTYSACSPLGLTFVLEEATKGQKILVCSYGSGAGCDAFCLTMQRDGSPLLKDVREIQYVSYGEYSKTA